MIVQKNRKICRCSYPGGIASSSFCLHLGEKQTYSNSWRWSHWWATFYDWMSRIPGQIEPTVERRCCKLGSICWTIICFFYVCLWQTDLCRCFKEFQVVSKYPALLAFPWWTRSDRFRRKTRPEFCSCSRISVFNVINRIWTHKIAVHDPFVGVYMKGHNSFTEIFWTVCSLTINTSI